MRRRWRASMNRLSGERADILSVTITLVPLPSAVKFFPTIRRSRADLDRITGRGFDRKLPAERPLFRVVD